MSERSDDEAPEQVSLQTTRSDALEARRLQREAARLLFAREKEGRRHHDRVLKEQAGSRRVSSIVKSDSASFHPGRTEASQAMMASPSEKDKIEAAMEQIRMDRASGISRLQLRSGLSVIEREQVMKLMQRRKPPTVDRINVHQSFRVHRIAALRK